MIINRLQHNNMEKLQELHLFLIWTAIVCGIISGAIIGLFFRKDNFLGGYNSWSRRMLRLGHISFFGLGFINFLFLFSIEYLNQGNFSKTEFTWLPIFLILGLITMPTCCFLSAWKKGFANFFAIPVLFTGLPVFKMCQLFFLSL